jgi:hypothetical protein
LHESVTKGILVPKDKYLIKKTFTELYQEKGLASNSSSAASSITGVRGKKRKSNENTTRESAIGKKQKVSSAKTKEDKTVIDLKSYKDEIERNQAIMEEIKKEPLPDVKDKELAIASTANPLSNKENKKITNFFEQNLEKKIKKIEKEDETSISTELDYNNIDNIIKKEKVDNDNNNIEVPGEFKNIYLHRINLKTTNFITSVCKKLGGFVVAKHPATDINNLSNCEYIIAGENFVKNDLKIIYAALNKIKVLNLTFFEQADTDVKYPEIENYILPIPLPQDVDKKEQRPLALDRYKIHLHESLDTSRPILLELVKLLGGEDDISEHLRLSDICIVNLYEKNAIPSHIKLLNQDFLIDSFLNSKLMDMENLKYKPQRKVKKHNKN